MTVGNKLTIAVVAAALGALIAPAFAQNGSTTMPSPSDQGMNMGQMRHGMMGSGMMSDRMMSGGMMGGCAEMMQSMNNGGNGKPNSQWQSHPPRNPENGS
ncbi:MAG: hypothetical protein EPN75_14495 [Beijerinckiaceae bacterium]|nr:MAG: hypothetical protein EPN75_14495 [Beijerinckiaceae bacterium]